MAQQKLIVITGASSGIGLATAKLFSQAGYHLLLWARRLEPMHDLGLSNAICQSVDVTDIDAIQSAIHAIDLEKYSIDCLINNAGAVVGGHFSETDLIAENAMVDLNIKGVLNCTKIIAPLMQTQKQGAIINVSSIGDRMFSSAVSAVYCATKAAIKQYTQSLHASYKDDNIRCCNVAPAYVDTPIWDAIGGSAFGEVNMLSAEELAQTILWIYQQPPTVCIRDMVITPTSSPI